MSPLTTPLPAPFPGSRLRWTLQRLLRRRTAAQTQDLLCAVARLIAACHAGPLADGDLLRTAQRAFNVSQQHHLCLDHRCMSKHTGCVHIKCSVSPQCLPHALSCPLLLQTLLPCVARGVLSAAETWRVTASQVSEAPCLADSGPAPAACWYANPASAACAVQRAWALAQQLEPLELGLEGGQPFMASLADLPAAEVGPAQPLLLGDLLQGGADWQ